MENFFFTKGFKFEKYINERLLEISDEGERRALKEVLKETLIPFYYHAENSYVELEKRFFQTQKVQVEKYEIITGVQKRKNIDITEEALVPMKYEDLNEHLIDIQDMKSSLQRGEAYTVMKIFVSLAYTKLRELENRGRRFNAILVTAGEEYTAEVKLKKNKSYLKQITDLYQVFESNGLEWKTVCAPYLSKYFDVQIVHTECPLDAEVIRISIDFEEYQNNIIYDFVPMWNVRFMEEKTRAYPNLAMDQIHYEHCINKVRFISGREYLVVSGNKKIWNVFRQDGELHIITNEEKPAVWKIMELGYDSLENNYDMPIFRNVDNSVKKRCIHTVAEMKRYIADLGYESYLKLLEIEQFDDWQKEYSTYSVDDFIDDEIRVSSNRPCLCFKFRPTNMENYLNQDIMSYLVSKAQWQLPEFKCVGELE